MTTIRKVFRTTIKNRHQYDYTNIIAIKEKVDGNAEVGTMWTETASFDKNTPIKDIIEWAKDVDGKLIISIDEATIIEINK